MINPSHNPNANVPTQGPDDSDLDVFLTLPETPDEADAASEDEDDEFDDEEDEEEDEDDENAGGEQVS